METGGYVEDGEGHFQGLGVRGLHITRHFPIQRRILCRNGLDIEAPDILIAPRHQTPSIIVIVK
jgi:hypothetical protein